MGDNLSDPVPETETTADPPATIWVGDERYPVDDQTTVADLKKEAGADPDTVLTLVNEDKELKHVSDDKPVLKYVEAGAKVGFQPVPDGNMFG